MESLFDFKYSIHRWNRYNALLFPGRTWQKWKERRRTQDSLLTNYHFICDWIIIFFAVQSVIHSTMSICVMFRLIRRSEHWWWCGWSGTVKWFHLLHRDGGVYFQYNSKWIGKAVVVSKYPIDFIADFNASMGLAIHRTTHTLFNDS